MRHLSFVASDLQEVIVHNYKETKYHTSHLQEPENNILEPGIQKTSSVLKLHAFGFYKCTASGVYIILSFLYALIHDLPSYTQASLQGFIT